MRCIIRSFALCLLLVAGAVPDTFSENNSFPQRLSNAALALTQQQVAYDPAYFSIPYPNGDVPAGKGVCTDVVIRAYRRMGLDLQQLVHEDMTAHRSAYPNKWGNRGTDKNIDHRRVPNLMVFFSRKGQSLPLSQVSADYQPGDVVCWDLGGGITHTGIVVSAPGSAKRLIVHNIGGGQVLEDRLFEWKVIGHYRYGGQ